ncbi:M28 family metallopeptidase [Deinococcus pimensis]|uniref:M28 family metallopeptidase n=1 Tax=Deinococcus pimensis TaxID=309888 RepID=UPI0004B2D247|nr:M28 family peptidase [Deinococcus pimensis]
MRRANVRGRIAVIARGGMLFRQKAANARAAGAVAVVIVNNAPGPYRGAVLEDLGLPVVSVGPEDRARLRAARTATLTLSLKREVVRGANVVALSPGARPEMLFGAHHDSFIGSPGLNDNGSGVAAVLEVARMLRGTPLAGRAAFVLFDGEEDRFQGSRAWVRAHPDVTRGLRGMLSLDMVGVAAEPLAVGGSASLVRAARRAVPTLGTFDDDGLSDHGTFQEAGVPAALLFRGLDANYHAPGDRLVDPKLVTETADVALRITRALLGVR